MTIEDVIKYFGTGYRLNKLTGMHHSNYNNWKERGYIPIETQIKIQKITNGELVADLSHDGR